jgi:hypothetical protein
MLRADACLAASWALILLTISGSIPDTAARPQRPTKDAPSGSGSGSGGGSTFPPHVTFLAAARRDTQCKNCPYENCLNALVLTNGTDIEYSCYTVGESVNMEQYVTGPSNITELTDSRTWLRHNYGQQLGDFCYVSPSDLPVAEIDCPSPLFLPTATNTTKDHQRLPYCGNKSQLNFHLPSVPLRTGLSTECMLCPHRDCEGVAFYPPDAPLEANCVLDDGWRQVSPLQPEGTGTYFRTTDRNCFVSLATLNDSAAGLAPGTGAPPPLPPAKKPPSTKASSPPLRRGAATMLPQCGPVPHLRLEERPPSVPSGGGSPAGEPGAV